MTTSETIHGLLPFRPDPERASGFAACLTEALWYMSDGRPYEEVLAASGVAFLAAADPAGCPASWADAWPPGLETLSRSVGLALSAREIPPEDPAAWEAALPDVASSLEERRPVIARGRWPGGPGPEWGVVTGLEPSGLLTGHGWRPAEGGGAPPSGRAAETLARPPDRVVLFGRELARPGARELAKETLEQAVRLLRGQAGGPGGRWVSGPAAHAAWAQWLESGARCRCGRGGADCHRRLALWVRSNRRWGGRFIREVAALRLGRLRELRRAGQELALLAGRLDPDCDGALEGAAGRVRELAAAELELAAGLEALLG